MSAVSAPDSTSQPASKKKKKGKKKANGKAPESAEHREVNGVKNEAGEEQDDEEEDEAAADLDRGAIPPRVHDEDSPRMPSSPPNPPLTIDQVDLSVQDDMQHSPGSPGAAARAHFNHNMVRRTSATIAQIAEPADTSARLDVLQQERNNLRNEVTELRRSLESLQSRHNDEIAGVREDLEQSQQGKEHAETQYRNLLGKVNTIRSQLGDRLKADAAELEQAKGKIEELESERHTAREENERLRDSISHLNSQMEEQSAEVATLRSRTNLSTSNWAKERDDLASREAYLREEYEVARQAMQDWEILATEERSRREALEEKVTYLEEQLAGSREAHERLRGEAETQGSTVDGLQRALRDVQEERKRELREMVEQSQAQLDQLRSQATSAEESASALQRDLDAAQKEVERALPFEKEVREKNLLIGKLRHEAVILNDHLTKALRFLKRGKPEDNVDRHLVSNHFLHFLALDRSDAKKFQVLQLIAALLSWTEEQREQAGLVRQGTGSLKLPVSPFRRTPSTPSLASTDFAPDSPIGGGGKESLAELWSEFLEREAEAGGGPGGSVRAGSLGKSVRSPSLSSHQSVTSPSTVLGGGVPLPAVEGRDSPDSRRSGT